MLTQHAARGASLMLAASLFGRIAALAAQIVTGLLLAEEQFGVFAIAIGIQAIAGILQGGNALSYLVTLPPSHRRFRTGTVFAISNGFYLIGVIPMLMFAPIIASHFDEPSIVPLLWILGVTMMLSPIRFVLRAKLNARLAFGASALASAINNLFVYPITIVLALWLRDAMALAIPVLVGAIAEIVFLWAKARPASTDFRPRRRFVRPLLYQFRWLAAGAVMMSLFSSGDYMVAEFLVETAVLGTYYFGYQLAVQPGRIFTTTVLNILVPVVKRLSHDRDRLVAALRRLLSTGGFAIAAINLSMLAMIEPLERVIWNGKWAGAVFTVQILAIGLTFTTILGIGMSPLMAQRRYPESVFCGGIRAVFMMVGAAVGALLWGTPDGLSLGHAGWTLDRRDGGNADRIGSGNRFRPPCLRRSGHRSDAASGTLHRASGHHRWHRRGDRAPSSRRFHGAMEWCDRARRRRRDLSGATPGVIAGDSERYTRRDHPAPAGTPSPTRSRWNRST